MAKVTGIVSLPHRVLTPLQTVLRLGVPAKGFSGKRE